MDLIAYQQFLELDKTHLWMRGRRSVYLGLIEHFTKAKPPHRILDLGAGVGGFLEGLQAIAAPGGRIFPVDVDAQSLAHIAARGFPGGTVADGAHLPYKDASFDLVCLFDAIEHTKEDQAVIREVARILSPDGHVFISVPAYQFLFANNDRVVHHYRRYRRQRLNELFAHTGLEPIRNTHSNVFLFPLILPTVLTIKAIEALFGKRASSNHTNLTWPMPRFAHTLLHKIFAAELPLSKRLDWPAGHSICALARKP